MIFFNFQRLIDLRLAVLDDLKEIIPPGYYDFVGAEYLINYDVELTQKVRKLEQNSSLSPRLSAAREVLMSHALYQLSIQRLYAKCAAYLDHENKTENIPEELVNDLKKEIDSLCKASKNLIESMGYWSSYLPEIERNIFNRKSLGYSIELAKERIVSFCGVRFEFLSDHINVLSKTQLNEIDKITIDSNSQLNQIANNKPVSQQKTPPGKLPNIAIGKLAVKAAWELECKLDRRATADEVIKELQNCVDKEDFLIEVIPHGVKWMTAKLKDKNYDITTCSKTLKLWNKSREPERSL